MKVGPGNAISGSTLTVVALGVIPIVIQTTSTQRCNTLQCTDEKQLALTLSIKAILSSFNSIQVPRHSDTERDIRRLDFRQGLCPYDERDQVSVITCPKVQRAIWPTRLSEPQELLSQLGRLKDLPCVAQLPGTLQTCRHQTYHPRVPAKSHKQQHTERRGDPSQLRGTSRQAGTWAGSAWTPPSIPAALALEAGAADGADMPPEKV